MQQLTPIAALSAVPGPVHLAIGFFDGVHLGHGEVIRNAQHEAAAHGGSAVVATFDPHPMRVVQPHRAPRLLTSTRHKALIMERLGVSRLLIIPFDTAMAALTPDEFVRQLADSARPLASISVGKAWAFGRNRAGNLDTLNALGRRLGFSAHGIPPVMVHGETVSSTRIRHAVERGDFAHAAQLLGREYSVLGTVVRGRQLGRTLGFPTANLTLEAEQLPPRGVYAVRALLRGAAINGVANFGLRPTVGAGAADPHFEVHLFDFSGDIYSETMEVFFAARLRGEIHFPSIDDLKQQIVRDAAQARAVLESG